MNEERLRREVRRLIDGLGPPEPGLAARMVAGLPDRPRRRRNAGLRLVAAAAAAVAIAAGVLLLVALGDRLVAHQTVPAGFGQLEARPRLQVPLANARSCRVGSGGGAAVRALDLTPTTYLSPSRVPDSGLLSVQSPASPGGFPAVVGGGIPLTIVAGTDVSGPILARAYRLDVPGAVPVVPATGIGSTAAGPGLRLEADARTRRWDVQLVASEAGCYALQLDGAAFSEVAVMSVKPLGDGGSPSGTPPPAAVTPAQAAATIRATVTGTRPVLLPTAIPADWTAHVTAGPSTFSVIYTAPDGARSVTLATDIPNPPTTAHTRTTSPGFRGDAHSEYVVNDTTDTFSARTLFWLEPGVNGGLGSPSQVPYALSATSLTDVELWQIAGSIR